MHVALAIVPPELEKVPGLDVSAHENAACPGVAHLGYSSWPFGRGNSMSAAPRSSFRSALLSASRIASMSSAPPPLGADLYLSALRPAANFLPFPFDRELFPELVRRVVDHG